MIRKIKNIYHSLAAVLANIIFFFPARKLVVIGVTGTDGKTTTASLICHILQNSGKKVALASTLGVLIDGQRYDLGFHVTTPNSFVLQRLLRRSVSKKAKYFVMEVTSHAINQHRILGIPFRVGVLTNVTYEHLDYHKTYDSYFKTKTQLLRKSEIAVANRDDGTYTFLVDIERLKKPENWITYGLSQSSDINPQTFPFKTKLLGEFNKYNVLAAITACQQLKIPDVDIRKAVETYINPVGRADIVYSQDFSVMIDFAHTPNAFEQILKTVRPLFPGRLIHVFGSAGKRDYIKRPMMGEISSQYSDIMILTAEDPRGENVSKITNEISSGIKEKKAEIISIPDRREAIQAAINMAGIDDLVIITGKSHEKSINYSGREEPWDEYEIVREAISMRRSSESSKK